MLRAGRSSFISHIFEQKSFNLRSSERFIPHVILHISLTFPSYQPSHHPLGCLFQILFHAYLIIYYGESKKVLGKTQNNQGNICKSARNFVPLQSKTAMPQKAARNPRKHAVESASILLQMTAQRSRD